MSDSVGSAGGPIWFGSAEAKNPLQCIPSFQLIGQGNNVLCIFAKLHPIAKNSLLYSCCCYSLYGSVTWDLLYPEIYCICTAWCIALMIFLIISALGSNCTLM